MNDEGVGRGPAFHREYFRDGIGVGGIRAQAIHRFSRECDQTSAAQNFNRLVNISVEEGPSSTVMIIIVPMVMPAGTAADRHNATRERGHKNGTGQQKKDNPHG